MAWNQYRPRLPEAEASSILSKYQIRLRAEELRDQQEVNLETEPRAFTRFDKERIRNVAFLWTIIVVAIAAVATWFLDQVLAAETVAAVTAIVIVTTLPRVLRASRRGAAS